MVRGSEDERPGGEFREILKQRARGPAQLGHLDPELCERAMAMILAGEATPAQTAGFLLVGRAAGDSPEEIAAYTRAAASFVRPLGEESDAVTVAGGFDGKLRTVNLGAAASLVAAAAGAKVLMIGAENTPPKEGRTSFATLRALGVEAPQTLEESADSLRERGYAATSSEHYLPELHSLLGLRWEMTRRTVLNVVEKLVSPLPGSSRMIGVTHGSFLQGVPRALVELGVRRALVFKAIEGSDEAQLDENAPLALVENGEIEHFEVPPESLGLRRVARSQITWRSEEREKRDLLAALGGEEGPTRDLIVYNAALRLWMQTGCDLSLLGDCAEAVRVSLRAHGDSPESLLTGA